MSQANSQVPPSFWRVFEESSTQRAIQQVADAMAELQAKAISQAAQAAMPDLRTLFARSQPRGIPAVAEMLAKINTESQLDRSMVIFNELLGAHLTAAQVAQRVEAEVPEAAPAIGPLLKDGGWTRGEVIALLALIVAVLGLLLKLQESQEQPAPAITPEQVEEIITRVVDEVDEREQRSGPLTQKGPP